MNALGGIHCHRPKSFFVIQQWPPTLQVQNITHSILRLWHYTFYMHYFDGFIELRFPFTLCHALPAMFSTILLVHRDHDDVVKWKYFPRYWSFVRGIHRSPVNSPHKGQWRGALMFSLICARINGWVNNGEAGDLRRQRAHYDVIVMITPTLLLNLPGVAPSYILPGRHFYVLFGFATGCPWGICCRSLTTSEWFSPFEN